MTYENAKKLQSEDEVENKDTGAALFVVSTQVNQIRRIVIVCCDDGNAYYHRELK